MKQPEIDLTDLAEHVFNQPTHPGNDASRLTYFNYEVAEGESGIVMRQSVHMPTRTQYGRVHVQVPEKLRENLRTLYGVEGDDDYIMGTTLVALADWASGVLLEEQKTLKVSKAK